MCHVKNGLLHNPSSMHTCLLFCQCHCGRQEQDFCRGLALQHSSCGINCYAGFATASWRYDDVIGPLVYDLQQLLLVAAQTAVDSPQFLSSSSSANTYSVSHVSSCSAPCSIGSCSDLSQVLYLDLYMSDLFMHSVQVIVLKTEGQACKRCWQGLALAH